MPPTTIRTPPPLSSFTPLAEHQSATPSSFYGAKPVLHYHVKGAKALYYKSHQSSLPIFSNLAQNGVADEEDRLLEAEVDVYVNSE
jgi:nucleotide-sensitive chloride channel 1A